MKDSIMSTTGIAERLTTLRATLPEGVRLVAVSKYHPVERIREAYDAGQRIFGENRVQELTQKADLLPSDIEWHLIGTLQRNKVKYIIPFVHTIHSIDSLALIREIEAQALRRERQGDPVRLLLQIHIAEEETKQGLTPDELLLLLESGIISELRHSRFVGLMGMATYTDDEQRIEREFGTMQRLFGEVKARFFADDPEFKELSIGMSGDYESAIRHGATYVRIGTAIFGEREY